MKKLLITGMLVSASSVAMAEVPVSGPWFVGGVYGQSRFDIDTEPVTNAVGTAIKQATKRLDNPHYYGLRAGIYMSPNVRVYGSYTYSDTDTSYGNDNDGFLNTSNKSETLLASADYLFGHQAVKPFVGVSMGVNRFKLKTVQSDDETAFTYGAQAGLNWVFTPSMDLEVGVQYLQNDNELTSASAASGGPVKSDLDHTENLYVSVDYRF